LDDFFSEFLDGEISEREPGLTLAHALPVLPPGDVALDG